MAELQPLEIKEDTILHKPFRNVTELKFQSPLPDHPYAAALHRVDGSLISVPLNFRDRPIGRFAVLPITREHAQEYNLKTPAGRVRYAREEIYAEGDSGEDSPRHRIEVIHEAPLIFAIGTATRSMRVYNELLKFLAVLDVEGIRYFLPVIDPFKDDYVSDHFRSTRSALIYNSWNTERQNGEPADFTVPGVPQSLQRLGIGFTQKL